MMTFLILIVTWIALALGVMLHWTIDTLGTTSLECAILRERLDRAERACREMSGRVAAQPPVIVPFVSRCRDFSVN